MPQLSQLSDVVLSQLFWLLLVLGFIYFVIGRGMVPKIQSTVDARDRHIADNLAASDAAKADADRTEADYRRMIDESRAEAVKHTAAAKADAAAATEQQLAVADGSIATKVTAAEADIKASRDAAMAGVEAMAAELAQDISKKLAGLTIGAGDATQAVKAALAHG